MEKIQITIKCNIFIEYTITEVQSVKKKHNLKKQNHKSWRKYSENNMNKKEMINKYLQNNQLFFIKKNNIMMMKLILR